jgi:hypothetical protein
VRTAGANARPLGGLIDEDADVVAAADELAEVALAGLLVAVVPAAAEDELTAAEDVPAAAEDDPAAADDVPAAAEDVPAEAREVPVTAIEEAETPERVDVAADVDEWWWRADADLAGHTLRLASAVSARTWMATARVERTCMLILLGTTVGEASGETLRELGRGTGGEGERESRRSDAVVVASDVNHRSANAADRVLFSLPP